MPRRPSSTAIDLALDIDALRHLVTRPQIADVLWSGDTRKALEEALRQVHGETDFEELERTVSQQELLTRMKLLPSLVERLYEGNNDHRAKNIVAIVEEIVHTNSDNPDSLQFQNNFVLLLLQAVLQASLHILICAELDDVGAAYRTTVDLIREMFRSCCEDSVSAHAFKKKGVKLVKGVAAALTQSNRKVALVKAKKFLKEYSNTTTALDLQGQVEFLEKELGPLAIRHNYVRSITRPDDTVHKRKGRGKKRHLVPDVKPDFFSDGSSETSNVTPDDESFRDSARDAPPEALAEGLDSEVESRSSADTPRPPKKRSRMSREVVDEALNDSSELENGEMPSRSGTPVSKSRGKRYPQLERELDGMNSPMFSETRPTSERVDHVVRHARSRGQNRTWRPRETRRRNVTRRRSPTSISQEESSPTYRGKRAPELDDDSDEGGYVRKGIDKDDEDAMDRMGREGEVLHDLHAKATQLQAAGPSDPLPDAIKDARQARRRNRFSDPSYSPGEDARETSPFPDSDDESDLKRKKMSRLKLVQTPDGYRSKRQGRTPAASRPAMYMFGKQCKTGRFEPLEDKLIVQGLREFGWGAWTEIARKYWEGEFTRAPLSLKDRARTLNLDPHAYPRRMELRGRPRLSDNRANNGNEDDEDEDEDDPIEAPNGTPGSGNGDEE